MSQPESSAWATPPPEPKPERFRSTTARYFHATRPPFLLASLIPCGIGLATAAYSMVAIQLSSALLSVIGALLAHAGVNLLNDYYDHLNGTDAQNQQRIFPFTGGSRFIQNGVISAAKLQRFGWLLLLLSALIGLLLLPAADPLLLLLGGVGLLIGWGYSAPPLALNSHGLGELAVGIGCGSLITVGCDMVQRGGFDPLPLLIALPYALLVSALLYINQFPDRIADAAAGKRHWVVRLGPQRARWGYLLLVMMAYLLLLLLAWQLAEPWLLLALPAALPSLLAARQLLRDAEQPQRLAPAIQFTILAMLLQGGGISAGLLLAIP